jgi:hypothetical protein
MSEGRVSRAVIAVGLTEQLLRVGVKQVGDELRSVASELSAWPEP